MLSTSIEVPKITEPIVSQDIGSILEEFNLGTSIQDLEVAEAVAQLREMNKDEPDIVFKGEKPVESVDAAAFCAYLSEWNVDCDSSHSITTSDNYEL
jgi:hypothetical protein